MEHVDTSKHMTQESRASMGHHRTHCLTELACYAPLLPTGITAQYMLASEAWTDGTFFKRVVDLHTNTARQSAGAHPFSMVLCHTTLTRCQQQAHRDFAIEEGFQGQVETSKHFCQEQCLRAFIDDCSNKAQKQLQKLVCTSLS